MAVIDNIVAEFDLNFNQILELIKTTSYGDEPHILWETFGMINALTQTNVMLIDELKKELQLESPEVDAGGVDNAHTDPPVKPM